MHIVLIGDSILDNATYVDEKHSVQDLLNEKMPDCKVSLLAVDGSLTSDIHEQLNDFPKDATHVFVSCGGNDAIDNVDVLSEPASNVEDALVKLSERKESFRGSYASALEAVCKRHNKVAAFTVYNKVPELNVASRAALALFNEVMLEELSSRNIPIIDLRVIFSEEQDYSPVSPIEPSVYGGRKIVMQIERLIQSGFESGIYVQQTLAARQSTSCPFA